MDDLDELKEMLKPASIIAPTKIQIKRWQRAVALDLKRNTHRRVGSTWYVLAAGLLIGFLSATLYFKGLPRFIQPTNSENSQTNATFEWISAKIE